MNPLLGKLSENTHTNSTLMQRGGVTTRVTMTKQAPDGELEPGTISPKQNGPH
jgi:hypothetical protein